MPRVSLLSLPSWLSLTSRLSLIVGALAGASCGRPVAPAAAPPAAPPPSAAAPAAAPDPVLALDPRIRIGTLDNGLTYYVLSHPTPRNRAQLWLGVNAGSVVEDDDQRGLAHFVEHMAFNGTAEFEKHALSSYLESIGMRFGADLNAYTSFDETVYMLQVPTEDSAVVDEGLHILHEWAGAVSFVAAEVEAERGVVLEEWRLGRGAESRVMDQQLPVMFAGSRYAERLPIGLPEIIQGAPREALVRFYRDWYRPDLMAIVAVGDFDADDIEQRIRSRFGDLAVPAESRERPQVAVPASPEVRVSIATDPELPQTHVSVINTMPHRREQTAGDYRRSIVEALYHAMLNARLDELGRFPDAPFMWASSATRSSWTRATDEFSRDAAVKEGRLQDALTALMGEVLRVERFGFVPSELGRAKRELLRRFEHGATERDTIDASDYAEEMLRHFFTDEMMPGRVAELAIVRAQLDGIELAELNQLASGWGGDAGRVVLVSGPSTMSAPAPAQVHAWLASVDEQPLTPYDDAVADAPLMAAAPTAGSVVATRAIPELGVTEWTLSNGAKVVVRPTDFKNDEVQLLALSPGGHSLVPDFDFDSARHAASVVAEGGVGSLSASQLDKALAGVQAQVSPYISELEEGVWGQASPRDLETFLQLVHLRFVAPRADEDAFASWKSGLLEWVRKRDLSPERAFFDRMGGTMAGGHRRRLPPTVASVEGVELSRAMDVYRARFANAGDFTFVIVGNVELATLQPLVETYLASLPANEARERFADIGARTPKGVRKETVRRGSEPKSLVYLTVHAPQAYSSELRDDLRAAVEVLELQLFDVLREQMSGVYGVNVWADVSRGPVQERSLGIYFGCAPDNVDTLVAAVFDQLAALRQQGPDPADVTKVVEAWRRERETDLRDNRFWLERLADAYRYGDDPRAIVTEFGAALGRITPARVKATAKRYLAPRQYVLGVLRPEAVSPE